MLEIEILPDFHSDFAESKKMVLVKYEMTRDKAKNILVTVCLNLAVMINKYELNGFVLHSRTYL